MIRGIAILSLTLLVVAWIPFVGPVVIVMTPLPILYFLSILGRVKGWAALAAAYAVAVGSLLLLGRPLPVFVLLLIGSTGVLLSEVLQRRYSIGKTIAVASLALSFFGIGFLLSHSWASGTEPWRLIELYIGGVIRENLQLYSQMNISAEQLNLIRENTPQITRFIVGLVPALYLSGVIIAVWLNVLAGRTLFGRVKMAFPDFGDLATWKAPEKLVWLLIGSGGLVLVPGEISTMVGLNMLIVCCLIYFFQGMAIAAFLFSRKRVPVALRWVFYALLVVQQYMVILVVAFGLFDIWVDFRKRITGVDAQA